MQNRNILTRLLVLLAVIALMSSAVIATAQGSEDVLTCDIEVLVEKQAELAAKLAQFSAEIEGKPYSALVDLYKVGEAYMALAQECGFSIPEFNIDAAIGDPERGAEIFTTQYAETGFSCSICHRVDSNERLIGPGLMNVVVEMAIELPEFSEDQILEYTGVEAGASIEDTLIGFIRTSILNPNVYVEEIYPPSLMPQTWGTVLSEQDVNDLIAYIVTLTDSAE